MRYPKTYIITNAVRIALPLLLAVGAFMGFPNDPQLSGFFWLFVFLWALTDMFGVHTLEAKDNGIELKTFTFANKQDADDALYDMRDRIDAKGQISIKELYALIGCELDGSDKYGWVDLKNACVRFVQDGWFLYLPQPVVLK